MLESFFHLQRRPFASIPSPDQYFPAESIEFARSSLVRLVERQEGPAIVVGSVGSGKSLLCQTLAESFRHRCRCVILRNGRMRTRRSLLQVILHDLGLPFRDMEESELRLYLIDHLANKALCPSGILLLVDEADSLGLPLLDELRALTNLSSDGRPSVRLVLFGGPRLEERFAHPRLESFNQRLAGRFYLEPFQLEETAQYIVQQFLDCGGEPRQAFEDSGMEAIHQATGGIPRLINQLTDHSLLLVAAGRFSCVDRPCVEEAWADLQQLPLPQPRHSDRVTQLLNTPVIEFGALADDPFATTSSRAPQESPAFNGFGEGYLADEEDELPFPEMSSDAANASAARGTPPFRSNAAMMFTIHDASSDQEGPAVDDEDLIPPCTDSTPWVNPFGEEFAEEELVYDPYLAMEQRHPGPTPMSALSLVSAHPALRPMSAEVTAPTAPNVTLKASPAAVAPAVVSHAVVSPAAPYPASETPLHQPAASAPPVAPAMPTASVMPATVELFVKTPELPSNLHRELRLDAPEAAATSASASPAAGEKPADNGPSHNYRRLFSSLRIHRS